MEIYGSRLRAIIVLVLIVLGFGIPSSQGGVDSTPSQRISGAAKFVYIGELIEESFDDRPAFFLRGIGDPECGSAIIDPSTREPFERLPASAALASGTEIYVPVIQQDAGWATRIAIQNVGDLDTVALAFFFDQNGFVLGHECAYIVPGVSYSFDSDSIPSGAKSALIQSLSTAAIIQDGAEELDIYAICSRIQGPIDEIKDDKGLCTIDPVNQGSFLIGQVHRYRTDQPPGEPVVSTQYNAFSNRMGDAEGEGENVRLTIPRVVISASADTVLNFFVPGGAALQKGALQNAVITLYREIDGASIEIPGLAFQGFHSFSLSLRNALAAEVPAISEFQGWAVVETLPGQTIPLPLVADLVYGEGRAVSSYLPGYLRTTNFSGVSDFRLTGPVLYEPGLEMQVSIFNVESSADVYTVSRYDALNRLIDSVSKTLESEEGWTVEFPDPNLATGPTAGRILVDAGNESVGVFQLLRRDERGNVLESISYNLHLEKEIAKADTFDINNKGTSDQEIGGADLLALPLAGKFSPQEGLDTEILLMNYNTLPGLTAATIYLYESGGIQDLQCVTLGPGETLRIPVDFPRLGLGSNPALVIKGTVTSQGPSAGDLPFNSYGLAAVAYQRTSAPPPPPEGDVSLAPGGNDAAMAYTGDNGSRASRLLMFPVLRSATETGSATVTMTLQGIEFEDIIYIDPPRAGIAFFNNTGLAGTLIRSMTSAYTPYVIENSEIPPDARSAAVFSFAPDDLMLPEFENIATLEDYNRFAGNLSFVFTAKGFGELEGRLLAGICSRELPSPDGNGNRVFSSYEAHNEVNWVGRLDFDLGAFAQHIPFVSTKDGFETDLHIQKILNTSFPVTLELREAVDPQTSPKMKSVGTLSEIDKRLGVKNFGSVAPKTFPIRVPPNVFSQSIRLSDLVGPGFVGTALIRAELPIVGVADVYSGGTLSTYTSRHAEKEFYTNVQIGDDDDDDDLEPLIPPEDFAISPGGTEAFGPLLYSPYEGWETQVHIQNLSGYLDAKVRVDFHDQSGQIVDTFTGFIPPSSVSILKREAQTFDPNLAPTTTGWVYIVSEEFWEHGSPAVGASRIIGVIHQFKPNGAGCVLESFAYNTVSVREAFRDQSDLNDVGRLLLTFPSAIRFGQPFGTNTDIGLANINISPVSDLEFTETIQGEGFGSTLFNPISLNERESLLIKTQDSGNIPTDTDVALTFRSNSIKGIHSDDVGFAGVAVLRADGLLPNEDCVVLGTSTPTPTATLETSPTPTLTLDPTLTLSPTPTATPTSQGGEETPTPSGTLPGGIDPNLLRADVNGDGRVDSKDILIVLDWWMQTYETGGSSNR